MLHEDQSNKPVGNKLKVDIKDLESKASEINKKLENYQKTAFSRFPLIFVLLSTFGVVATFYGFEKIIDKIPFFANNPFMVLVVGIIALVTTGTLYKKLS